MLNVAYKQRTEQLYNR